MYLKPLLVILFALSFIPYLATHISEVHDSRVELVLHAMPVETYALCVANAPNVVFDQSVIQLPDPETYLQLYLMQCFRQNLDQIHGDDVSLCVRGSLGRRQREGSEEVEYPAAHFLFLKPNESRDKKLQSELHEQSMWMLTDSGNTVYEFSGGEFLCLPKPGLLIFTNNRSLMHTILSRLDLWWQKTVALPSCLAEWKYVNQRAPYWGLEHESLADNRDAEPERSMFKGHSAGTTFDYMDNDYDLNLTHVNTFFDTGDLAQKSITEFYPHTGQRLLLEIPAKHVTRMKISDARIYEGMVPFILENFSLRPSWRR